MEDDGWQFAMNLVLEVESVSSHFVSCALLSGVDNTTTLRSQELPTASRTRSNTGGAASEFDFHESLLHMSAPRSSATVGARAYEVSLHQQAFEHAALEGLSRLAQWSVRFFEQTETVGVALCGRVVYVPKYVVSKSPVSIHLPLHRFVGKLLLTAAQGQADASDDPSSQRLSVRDCLQSMHRLLVAHRLAGSHGTSPQPYAYDSNSFHRTAADLDEACARLGDDDNVLLQLMEAPVMALVFAAQVRQGMWRRNGLATANLAFNYAVPVLCKYYREPDLALLQGAVLIGLLAEQRSGRLAHGLPTDRGFHALTSPTFQRFVTLLTHRFEIAGVVEAFRRSAALPADHPQHQELQNLLEAVYLLFAEYLRHLCQFFTHIPASFAKSPVALPPGADAWAALPDSQKLVLYARHHGLMAAVMREVVHEVLGGCASVSQLARIKGLLGTPQRTVSDRLLTEAVGLLCNINGDAGESAQSLSLKEAAYQFFDAEHPGLSTTQATAAFDRVKERLKQTKKLMNDADCPFFLPRRAPMNPYVPCVFPLALPDFDKSDADNVFVALRSQLASPFFGELLFHFANVALAAKGNKVTLLGRLVHLLTLQLHCRPGDDWLVNYDAVSVYHLPLLRLLVPLFTDKTQLAESEPFYHEGLGFVLYELAFHNDTVRAELERLGFLVDYFEHQRRQQQRAAGTGADADAAESKPKKKKAKPGAGDAKLSAQQKALDKMKSAAAVFASSAAKKKTGDVDDDGGGSAEVGAFDGIEDDSEDEKEETDPCILCKEKKEGAAKGFLCFVQGSAATKNFLLQDLARRQPDVRRRYRVVSLDGCEVYDDFRLFSDSVKDNRARCVGRLAPGDVVTAFADESQATEAHKGTFASSAIPPVITPTHRATLGDVGFSHALDDETARRGENWLLITAPVAGWVRLYVSVFSATPDRPGDFGKSALLCLLDALSSPTSLCTTVGRASQVEQSNDAPGASMLGVQPFHTGRVKSKFTRKLVRQLAPAKDFCFLNGGGEKMHVASCGHAMHFSCFDDFYSAK